MERFRLYPTKEQKLALARILGLSRELYNRCIEEREGLYAAGIKIYRDEQLKRVTALKSLEPKFTLVPYSAAKGIVGKIDFHCFHNGGLPPYAKKESWRTIPFPGKIVPKANSVLLPTIGEISAPDIRHAAPFFSAWVKNQDGRWFLETKPKK